MGQFQWKLIIEYLPRFKDAFITTILLFLAVLVITTIAGILLAVLNRVVFNKFKIGRIIINGYSWIFRSLPELIVLLFCYLGLPLLGINIQPIPAAILGFSITGIAYQYEIFNAGFSAIDSGQYLACRALGIPMHRTLTKIIFPQMLRVITPSYITYITGASKRTSAASAIAVNEIMGMAKKIMQTTVRPFETIFIAMILYSIISSVFMILEILAQKKFGKYVRNAS